jgi:NADPH:quinone reductase-like Zn-dependent oxidoreductase
MLSYRKSEVDNREVLVNFKWQYPNDADYDFPLTLGNELSGVIEAGGKDVVDFQVGNRVYTRLPVNKIGAFAVLVLYSRQELDPITDLIIIK